MVMVIVARSLPLNILFPVAIEYNMWSVHNWKKGDLESEGIIKYAIKERRTNHGGIVTAGKRFRATRTHWMQRKLWDYH